MYRLINLITARLINLITARLEEKIPISSSRVHESNRFMFFWVTEQKRSRALYLLDELSKPTPPLSAVLPDAVFWHSISREFFFPFFILLRLDRSPMSGGGGRTRPNILMTGTPGTGKSTTCSLLAEATRFRHINVSDLVREKGLHDGWDDEFDCHIINEDLVGPFMILTLTLDS